MTSKTIQLGGHTFLVVDLTKPLTLDQEVYPGDPKPSRKVFSDIFETGWHHYIHEIGDHHFQPHGDAPNHQNPELIDKGFEVFDLDWFFNPAFMIDLSLDTIRCQIQCMVSRFRVETSLEDLLPFEPLLE